MEIIGLIAEYNPLHNGHLYHINKIKEKYPNSLLVLVLNGYFLQRGEVSIISKYDKTLLALEYGVDIDPKEVKKLFNERAQQLQKENIKKSQLQQREEELSDLEMERDELLLIEKRDEQQNIGE